MKRFLSVLMVMMILCSLFTISTFAANDRICPSCGGQLSFADVDFGIAGSSSFKCLSCGKYYFSLSAFGHKYFQVGRAGSSVSGGASVETPKQYYTAPSSGSGGTDTTYNGGTTSYYSVMNTQNNTLNFTTYNKTTNNYTQNNYTYNNYTYNNEYNYYTYNIDNHNYYVTNNYTYVTIVYPDGTKDDDGNDNYESVDIYYQLPDGRNSSYLTVDQVWGEYFIYNFVNYQSIMEDDGITYGLWHLDGNTVDDSYHPSISTSIAASTYTYSSGRFDSGMIQTVPTAANRYFWIYGPPASQDNSYTMTFWVYYSSTCWRWSNSQSAALIASNVYPTWTNYAVSIPTDTWVYVSLNCRNDKATCDIFVDGKFYNSGIVPYWDNNIRISNNVKFNKADNIVYYSSVLGVDEIRVGNDWFTSDGVPIQQQPWDNNLVFVVPSDPVENDVAIMSQIPVSTFRVGGVRPTYPDNGSIYVYLENDVVKSVQQYQNNGWFNVDASIFADGSWKDFKGLDLSEYTFGPDEPSPSPDPGECSHEYVVDSEKAPTCTVKGSTTYKCKLCGDRYTEDIPALGHDWQIVGTGGGSIVSPLPSPSPDSGSSVVSSGSESISELTSSEPPAPTQPPATEPEYTLYRCSRCGIEYKDYEGSGPPSGGDGEEEDSGILGMLKKLLGSIVNGIVSILETVLGGVIKLLVSLIDELVSGLTSVIDGLISSMGQIANFGGTFKDFLGQVFPFIPSEIIMLLGFSLSLSIILMIIKFFRG